MNVYNIVSVSLIVIGAIMLSYALWKTRLILRVLKDKSLKKYWRSLSYMMAFFVVGYLACTVLVISGDFSTLVLLTGLVFMGGGAFVFIVVNVGLLTVRNLKHSSDELEKQRVFLYDAYSKLEAANENLLEKNREMLQFAYVVSHDLQEPLRTVNSFLDIIEKDIENPDPVRSKKYFEFIKSASIRMSSLIKDVLDFSRLGSGNVQVESFSTEDVMHEVEDDLSNVIKNKDAIVEYKDLPTIKGLKTEFRLLLQNLVSNALKFMPPNIKPEVHVSAEKNGLGWKFAVKDNGIGISAANIQKIFTVFQRLHTTDQYPGTGIGLAHCKKVVDLHNGEIWVESEVGKGSTFYFTISEVESSK